MRILDGCPSCGERDQLWSVESMAVHYELAIEEDGTWDHTGTSEDFLDTAENISEEPGKMTLWCDRCSIEFEIRLRDDAEIDLYDALSARKDANDG